MGTLSMKDAGFNIGVNVHIKKIHKRTGKIITERKGHNRCLRSQLMGITKFLNGEYNETQPQLQYYDWIPRYLGVGTNIAAGSTPAGVSTHTSINDTQLLHEISPRVKLPEKNKIINRSTQSYIQLVITTYLPENYYNGQIISEAGLFSKATGNNCLFRITFEGIPKDPDSVIEISWTISIISVDSGNQPYEEMNKDDLKLTAGKILDKISELYPPFKDACDSIKNEALYELSRMDSSIESVDRVTTVLAKEYTKLLEVDAPLSEAEVAKQVDEINGETV